MMQGRGRVRSRIALIIGVVIGAATPALAFQIPTTPSGTWTGSGNTQAATKDTPSALRTTVNVTGTSVFSTRNDVVLQVQNAATSPTLPTATNGVQTTTIIDSCQTAFSTALVCAPGTLGTLTFAFTDGAGQPIAVRNPVLHASRLGGFTAQSGNTRTHTARLQLTTAGATLGTPSTGSRIQIVGGNAFQADLAQITANTTAGTCPNAGCGSIPITGTVSSLSFNVGAARNSTVLGWGAVGNQGDGVFWTVSYEEDFGDAPATYDPGTAASHLATDLVLGTTVTADNRTTINGGATGTPLITPSPLANATAAGDSDDANPTFPALNENMSGQTYVVPVPYSGGSRAGQLCGWIDFNLNGAFDAGERACGATAAGSGTVNLSFTVPADIVPGTTVARFRVGYTAAQIQNPTGLAHSGEVEDYQVTIQRAADLVVTKTGPATAVQGTTVSYTITVTNNGRSNVTGAQIADTVPSNLTGVSWTCAVSGTADCNTGLAGTGATGTGNAISLAAVQLNAGAGNSVTITVSGTATTTGTFTNTATVSPPAGIVDTNTANNTSSVTTTITPAADLAVTKTGPATVVQGNTVTYTVTVTNNGPSNVTGAQIADAVPSNLTGVAWTCAVAGTADCNTATAGTGDSGSGNPIALNAVQLNAGAGNTITLTVTGTATTTGSFTNTATVAPPAGTTDPDTANNSSSVTTTITPAADLAVTKTGPANVVQGNTVTYNVTVTNNGPSNVTSAQIADAVPSNLTSVTWSCAAAGTADCDTGAGGTGATGSGNAISLTAVQLNAGAGNTITLTVTGTATTTGTFTNTATVTPPAGTTDPNNANNSSSVTTTITPAADLAVTKTGPATIVQGNTITYTVVVTNNGPSPVANATVNDLVPANITGVAWTCVAAANCAATSGSGNLSNQGVTLANGQSATFTITGTATTTGTFTNTATVAPPAGTTDPNTANNTSSVTTTITPAADLAITKAGPATVVQGNTVTYTITVTNNGPSNVSGATVSDTVPANLTGVTWTCVSVGTAACGTANGSGNAISLSAVQLNAGAGNSITITVQGTATTTGSITNTATVAPPAGTTDPNTANDSSSVVTEITPAADLAITKTGPASAVQGTTVTYTIVATNGGPSDVTAATIADNVPSNLTSVSWTCTGAGGAACGTASGSGNAISLTNVSIPAGAANSVTITVTATATTVGSFTNTATISPPAGTTDPNTANNSASQPTTITPAADLAITKTGPTGTILAGQPVTYTITATNNGPSPVTGADISDTVPADIVSVSWSCSAAGAGSDCDNGAVGTGATGTGNTIDLLNVDLPVGGTITITIDGTAGAAPAATITNTATVAPPAGVTDPNLANNSASTTASATPAADLAVVKSGPATVVQGNTITYTVVVTNNGPSAVTNALVNDAVPANITLVTWTCAAAANCATTSGAGSLVNEGVTLASGQSVTFTITGTATTTGTITNTATVTPPGGTVDGNTANNTSSVVTDITPAADLAITKSGTATAVQGNTVTYAVAVTNNGPSPVTAALVNDAVPANLTSVTWTCVQTVATGSCAASGSGDIVNQPVNLSVGGQVTFTITGTATTVGSFTNTATVATPAGTTDPTPANNTASQPTTITPAADLAIAKTGSPASLAQGETVTYTVTGTNNGPSDVSGASIVDTVPSNLTNVAWTCIAAGTADCDVNAAGTGANGSGNAINLSAVQIAAGAGNSVTLTITGTATTVGTFTNTATISPPGGTTDLVPGNDSDDETTTITPSADLAVTKTGTATVVQGNTVTYTITATNNGPSPVTGASVVDNVPVELTNVSFSCVVTGTGDCDTTSGAVPFVGSGSNNVNLSNVQLNVGASLTITVTATATTVGSITNMATVATPAGTTDPTPANNTASQPTTITPSADLAVTKTGPATVVQSGGGATTSVTYTITVTNNGPSPVTGALVNDDVPSNLTSVTWTCAQSIATGTCAASGSGDIVDESVNLSVGGQVTFTVTGTPTTVGSFTNTVTVAPPAGTTDPNTANNSASQPTTITPAADLQVIKTGPASVIQGQTATYTIIVTNNGPSDVTGAQVADTVPAQFTNVTFGCAATGAADCDTTAPGTGGSGSGNAISLLNVQLAVGATLTISVDALATTPSEPAAVTNTATVAAPAGTTDPTPANNTSSVNTTIFGIPAIDVNKSAAVLVDTGPGTGPDPGDTLRYTIVITNTGTGAASGVTLTDIVDSLLTPSNPTTTQGTASFSGQNLNATIGSIAVNGSVTITYDAVVPAVLPAGVTQVANQALVSGANFPTEPSNDPATPADDDPTVVPLTAAPLIAVDKAVAIFTDAAPTGPSPGDVFAYTLTITNTGNQNATAVAISDLVDPNVTLIPATASASQGSITAGAGGGATVAATLGTIAGGGGTATVTYRVQVPNPIPAGVTQVENQAVTTGGNFPSTLSNDPSTPTPDDPTVLPLAAEPSIDVTKAAALFTDSDGDGVPSPGDTLLYTITVTNTGNTGATGVTLTDTIDGTFTSITNIVASPGSATLSGQTLSATFGTIPGGGGTATLTYRALIPDPLPTPGPGQPSLVTQVSNQALVSGNNFPATPSDDPSTPTGDDPTVTPLTAAPRIAVDKQDTLFTDADGDGVPSPGDTLLYTVTITNSGNTTANAVTFADTVDPNTQLIAGSAQASPAAPISSVTQTTSGVNATFTAIPGRGGQAIVTFRVRVRSPLPPGVTEVANQALVSGANFTSTPSNDPDTAPSGDPTVTPLTAVPAVSATKTAALVGDVDGDGQADPGDTLAYTVTITNSGNRDATSVNLADVVEPNLSLVAGSVQTSPSVTATVSGANISATWPVVQGDGGTAVLSYRATVVNPLPPGVTQVANQANITGSNFPPTVSDDPGTGALGDPTVTPVVAQPIVEATKGVTLAVDSDGNGVASPGDTLQYVVTITNTGNQDALDLQFRDTVGPNQTVIPASLQVSPGAPISSNLAATTTSVQADFSGLRGGGGTATVAFQVTVANPWPIGATQVENQGNVQPGPGGNFTATLTDDPSTTAVDDPTITPIAAAPVVTRVKTVALQNDVAPTGPSAGDTLRYTITLTNTGNQLAQNASLTDLIDSTFVLPLAAGPTASGGGTAAISGRTITASWPTITPGAGNAVTLTFDALLPASLPAGVTQVRNQGTVTGGNFTGGSTDDPTTAAPDDPNVTPLLAAPVVSATKIAQLAIDADGDGVPSPGDTLLYTIDIRNTGNQDASGVTYSDTIDPNLILQPQPGPIVTSTQGTPVINAPATGGGSFNIPDIGTIPGGGVVTVLYQAQVPPALPAGVTSVSNQGIVDGGNIPSSVTDDPSVPGTTDPTVTPLTLRPLLDSTKAAALVVDADGDGLAEPGDTLQYTVTITNVGNQEATAVEFNDVIEPNLALVAGSVAVNPAAPVSTVTTTATSVNTVINSIPGAGGTAVVTFRVTIDNPLPGGVAFVENQGTVSATGLPAFPTDDPATGAPDDPTRTPVVAAPVIAATKTVAVVTDTGPGTGPDPGDTLLYTITITNTGNQSATNVAVSDIIDTNLQVDQATLSPNPGTPIGAATFTPAAVGTAPFGGTINGTFTAIPGGGNSVTISYQATVRDPVDAGVTQVANQAQVTGDNFPATPTDDPRTGPGGDPTVTPITAEPLVDSTKNVSLAIDADGNGVASPGDTLAYSIEIINSGNREATGVAFSDTVPANTTLVAGSVTVSQGSITQGATGGGTVAANLGSLAGAGGSATVGFRVTINNPLPAGVSQVANQGTVSGTNFGSLPTDDPRTGTNDDPTVTPLTAAPLITVDKDDALVVDADGNGVPSPGDTLLYTITITNSGNQTATGISLTDIVEPNLINITAVATSPGTATLAGSTITATIGDLGGGGQQATVSFRAQIVNPIPAGVTQVANQANVSGGNFPTTPSNDPSTAQGGDPTVTPITAAPVVSATKRDTLVIDADGDGVPSPGDTLEYTIIITNSGNTTARFVQYSDTFDPNVTLVAGSIATTPAGTLGVLSATGFDGEFPGIAGGGGTASISYRVVVANPLPAGVTQVANQTVITPNPTGGNFAATVSDDPDTGAPDDPTVTPLTATPRIAVTKRDSLFADADGNGVPSPGDTLQYTITIVNSGNQAATGVAINDIIDANLTGVTAVQASQGTASLVGNTLTASLGTIAGGGGTATVTYRAMVVNPLPPGVTQVANQATVTGGNFPSTPSDDPDTGVGGDPTITPLTANPVVGVTKTDTLLSDADGNGVASPGDTLLYTIVTTNTGNSAATGVTLSDAIDSNLAASNPTITNAPPNTATITGQVLTADLGTIPGGGASVTITYQAVIANPLPAGVTQVANQATVSGTNVPATLSDDPDTQTSDDPTVTPLVAAPVISVDKAATLFTDADGNGTPSPGDTIQYTITTRNTGNQAGVGSVMNDVNDPNVTLLAGTVVTSQGTVTAGNAGGNTVSVDLGVIPGGGATATVTYRVRVVNPLPAGVTSVANQAVVSGSNFPTTPSNDPSTQQPGDPTVTQLTAAPVLSSTKAASLVVDADGDGLAEPGDTVLYLVTIRNSGNQAASNTDYSDTVDPNTTIVAGSVQPSQGAVTAGAGGGQNVGVAFGTVPGGASVTLSYRVTIAASVPAGTTQIANQGTVAATGVTPVRTDDPATGPLGDPTVVQLVTAPRVLMTKADVLTGDTNGDGAAGEGEEITYSIVIENAGNTPALNVTMSDTPDANTTLVVGSVVVSGGSGATIGSGNSAGNTAVGVVIPSLAGGGARVTVSFRVRVIDPLPESVTQVANQAILTCSRAGADCVGGQVVSDDPATAAQSDPTVTPLRRTEAPALRSTKAVVLATDADRNGGASSGDTLQYAVVITNVGDGTARGVTYTDTVDANTTLVAGSVSTTAGAIVNGQQGGRTLQVALGDLAPGSAVSVRYRVTINRGLATSVNRIRNQGTVSAIGVAGIATDDPNTAPGGDPTDLAVVGGTRLAIRKFGPLRAAQGTRTLYSIRVTNRGPNTAAGVVVTDRLPSGLVLVGRPRNATVRGRTITWRIANLPVGRSVVLTVPVRVTAKISSRITNTASATASNAGTVRSTVRTRVIRFVPPRPTG